MISSKASFVSVARNDGLGGERPREALAVPGIRLAARYHKKMPYPRTKSLCASSAKKTAAHGIQEPDKFFFDASKGGNHKKMGSQARIAALDRGATLMRGLTIFSALAS